MTNSRTRGASICRLAQALVALSALLITTLGTRRAAAESAEGQREPAAYRQLIEQAVSEFDATNFEESRALFIEAHGLFPNARTLRGLGMTDFELRDYPDAIRNLEQALASQTRALEGGLRAETERLLERAYGYVSRVTLKLEPASAEVYVDDKAIPVRPEQALLLSVGEHEFQVRASGYLTEHRALTLRSRGDETLEIRLRQGAESGSAETLALKSKDAHEDTAPRTVGPWVLTGISGALLVAGVVTLSIGFKDLSKVEDAPQGSSWSSVEQENKRAPILTGAGFTLSAVGIAGVVTGLIWGLKKPSTSHATTRLRLLANGRF